MHQSIPSASISLPRQTLEEFLEVVKSPTRVKIFLQEHDPQDKKDIPRNYFRESCQPFLLIEVEILEFCSNQTLKRIGRLSNYSLFISSSFSFSTIFKVLKFSPCFETDFVTSEQQQMVDQLVAEK